MSIFNRCVLFRNLFFWLHRPCLLFLDLKFFSCWRCFYHLSRFDTLSLCFWLVFIRMRYGKSLNPKLMILFYSLNMLSQLCSLFRIVIFLMIIRLLWSLWFAYGEGCCFLRGIIFMRISLRGLRLMRLWLLFVRLECVGRLKCFILEEWFLAILIEIVELLQSLEELLFWIFRSRFHFIFEFLITYVLILSIVWINPLNSFLFSVIIALFF